MYSVLNTLSEYVYFYISKTYQDFKQYKTYLENFFNKMKNSNKAIFIVGDTNLNLTDYETNIKVKS